MISKTVPIPQQSRNKSSQLQIYQNKPIDQPKLPLPDYNSLVELTKLHQLIVLQAAKLEQRQLQLQATKEQYRQKLLSEENDIRSRVITLKKRQNIAQVVEKIRQSELELQNKILERMDKYQPTHKLDKNQKHNLFVALINKLTDVN
jgi:predicted O-linked N-acetylglucosamine transferase (SPINDLY family)